MTAARVRLALTIVLFVGWLSYLGYLVYDRPERRSAGEHGEAEFVVLSRPQIIVSDIDLVARARPGSDKVTVKEVLYPDTDAARSLVGKEIKITNLDECHAPVEPASGVPDLSQEGDYLLPLQDPGPNSSEYRVTSTPRSPGFAYGTPRIYPISAELLAQYRRIKK
jgi:hypothetical protein